MITTITMPDIAISTIAADPTGLMAPEGHTVLAQCGKYQGTGTCRAEAVNTAIGVWAAATIGELVAVVWEANRDDIYAEPSA